MVVDRFLKYIKYDTQSSDNCKSYPSTKKQLILANLLLKELIDLNVKASIDKYGYVTATIKGNHNGPKIGFIAHYDTSSDMPGKNIKPQIIRKYDGSDIDLNNNIKMSLADFPILKKYIGHDLITTNGKTLLGADDKAGVAEIMAMVDFISNNPNIKHGDIKIAFTPDEEIGNGTKYFDLKKFNADFAYTIDGYELGNLAYENFNAASANITFLGKSIHPGNAKNKMINSMHLAYEFHNSLPKNLDPAKTEKYEGFNHMISIKGSVEKTNVDYIIRNHDDNLLEKQKKDFITIRGKMNKKYSYEAVKISIKDSYKNMADHIKKNMHVVTLAIKAMEELNITPNIRPIRGGTDGANLTSLGLPTPNLGNGSQNHHSKYEFVSINEMEMVVELLVKIVALSPSLL